MKKISIFLLAIVSTFATISCDKDFEDVNYDPNRPHEVPAHLLLSGTIRNTQTAIYGVQQGGDMGLCWAQQWSKVQYNSEERYIPRRVSIDFPWRTLYTGVIYDAKSMHALAVAEGNDNLQAIALVMQANAFQILTDLYGPIPFSQAGIKGNLKPAYDSQEDVYDGILEMLTDADALLQNNNGEVPAGSDLIFAGDMSKWRKFTNSLKFKALMRISKVRNVSAELQALADSGLLMTSNADSAEIYNLSAGNDANPIFNGLSGRLEYKVSSVLVDKMETLNDPRLPVYAKPVGSDYIGNVPGDESLNYSGTSGVGAFYNRATLPGVILSYAQVEFYLAEAIIKGYVTGGDVASIAHFQSGIIANFEFNGLDANDATAYYAQGSLLYNEEVVGSQVIGEQMWLALYGQGFEAWTEWRRTEYPALVPVIQANEDTIPSRLYYAQNEASVNQANYSAASATLANGDKLTSRLWWMN